MPYIYNDEDNAPMNDEAFDRGGHNPTVYQSAYEARMYDKHGEPALKKHDDGCWSCRHYNGDFCTILWNNLDEAYKVDWRDAKDPDDKCDEWEHDEDAIWEDYHGTNSGCTMDP